MKKFLIATMAAISIILTPAAEGKLNRSQIETQAQSTDYAILLKRFNAGEQLTEAEYATVYYGSALQPGFIAGRQYADIAEIYASGDMGKTLRRCEESLNTDPTNLGLLFKAFAASTLSTDESVKAKAESYRTRINGICDAIFASGTGVTESSPYVVIRPSDIDEFMVKYLQPTAVTGRARIGALDAAKVTFEGVDDEVILYFGQF